MALAVLKDYRQNPREGLRSGHIPSSVNVAYKDVLENGRLKSQAELKRLFAKIDSDKPMVFTCGSGLDGLHCYAGQRNGLSECAKIRL